MVYRGIVLPNVLRTQTHRSITPFPLSRSSDTLAFASSIGSCVFVKSVARLSAISEKEDILCIKRVFYA